MNIFFIDRDPIISARWLVDRHILKMGMEATQMLCTAYHEQGVDAPYRSSHRNHPSSVWCRSSYDNFQWLIIHAYAIFDEYTARYGKTHKSQSVLEWCGDNIHRLSFDTYNLTKFAIAISPDSVCRAFPEFNENDPILCYRLYYQHDKKHLHQWKRNKPDWII